jgi:hypothetical protein
MTTTMRNRTRLWAWSATLVACAWSSSPALALPLDHLQCHRVIDKADGTITADVDTAAFGLQPGCTVQNRVRQWCEPAAADVLPPVDPNLASGEDLHSERLCYRIHCSGSAPAALQASDRFGTRIVLLGKSKRLCTTISTPTARR